jgi:hypothetical protein
MLPLLLCSFGGTPEGDKERSVVVGTPSGVYPHLGRYPTISPKCFRIEDVRPLPNALPICREHI